MKIAIIDCQNCGEQTDILDSDIPEEECPECGTLAKTRIEE